MLETDQILVGRNNTRRAYNTRLRERLGREEGLPVAGDKLVCLRNNRSKGLFNGGLWAVKERGVGKSGSIITLRIAPEADAPARRSASRRSRSRSGANAFSAASRISIGHSARNTTNSITAMC